MAAILLRQKVFVEEQGIPINKEIDGKDEQSTHVIALNKNEVVGTGRLTIENKVGILSRIAIEREYRGLGLGKKIIVLLEQEAKNKEVKLFTLTPHKHLVPFYASLGYLEYGIPVKVGEHILMKMRKSVRDDS